MIFYPGKDTLYTGHLHMPLRYYITPSWVTPDLTPMRYYFPKQYESYVGCSYCEEPVPQGIMNVNTMMNLTKYPPNLVNHWLDDHWTSNLRSSDVPWVSY
jgi:hypothetical protein